MHHRLPLFTASSPEALLRRAYHRLERPLPFRTREPFVTIASVDAMAPKRFQRFLGKLCALRPEFLGAEQAKHAQTKVTRVALPLPGRARSDHRAPRTIPL